VDQLLVASNLALWLMVLAEGFVILVLLRQIGLLFRRMPPVGARSDANGPQIGAEVVRMKVADLGERTFEIGGTADRRRLLVFLSPGCQDCRELAPALRSIGRSDVEQTDLTIISISGTPDENRKFIEATGLEQVRYALSPRAGLVYGVSSTPYALLVEPDGNLAQKGVVNHLEHLESLLEFQPSLQPA
jgi:methylamine dehydrogenase accessory protein MauD